MRDLLNLFESNVAPYTGGEGTLIDHGRIQGDYREGMTAMEAIQFLTAHPDGYLAHDALEEQAFVTTDETGQWLFYDPVGDKIDRWDWADLDSWKTTPEDESPFHGWAYLPASEMALTNGGMGWWDEIKAGKFTPVAVTLPSLSDR